MEPEEKQTEELGQRLSSWNTVFQGELIGIQLAADWLIKTKMHQGEEVNFYIDSSSAIQSLFADKVSSKTQLRAIELLDEVARDRNTMVNWIKSHQGHSGNDWADESAKAAGTDDTQPRQITLIPRSAIKAQLQKVMVEKWNC